MEDDNKKEETKNLEKKGDANIVISELLIQIKELKKDIAELKENNAKEIEKIKSEANEEKIQAILEFVYDQHGEVVLKLVNILNKNPEIERQILEERNNSID